MDSEDTGKDETRAAQDEEQEREWRLMQIVECAESKLMRHKRHQEEVKSATLLLNSATATANNQLGDTKLHPLVEQTKQRQWHRNDHQRVVLRATEIATRGGQSASSSSSGSRSSQCGGPECSSSTNMTNRRHNENPRAAQDYSITQTTMISSDEQQRREGLERPTVIQQLTNAGLQKVASTEHSQQQQQQHNLHLQDNNWPTEIANAKEKSNNQFSTNWPQDERDLVTPTNDLIRALIHRDRLALSGVSNFRPKQELTNSSERLDTDLAPSSGKRKKADSPVLREKPRAPDMTAGCLNCSAQDELLKTSSRRDHDPHADKNAIATSPPLSDRGELSMLISGLHLRQVQEVSRSPEKLLTSEPMVVTTSADESSETLTKMDTSRRNSTYMLPILLNQPRFKHHRSSSDLDLSNSSDTDSDQAPTKLAITEPVTKLDPGQQSVQARLSNSASSPSALSTPTNISQGCGGACCNPQARSNKLEESSETQAAPPPTRRMSLFSGRGVGLTQTGQWRRRQRIGSNPTESQRLMGVSADKRSRQQSAAKSVSANRLASSLLPVSRKQSYVDQSLSSRVNNNHKRHSLINIFSSGPHNQGTGSLLVNRLSHPRSFFSNHSSSARHHQHQASTESGFETEHYDPLIPESGFKIVVMGTSGSGKTSIIQRFLYNSFSWRHSPTVEDTYFIEFPYMKNIINISISDTSGTYQFPAMRRLAINSGDAFILVYSVDDPRSLDEVEQLRQTILDEREQAYLETSASLTSNESSSGLASINSQSISANNSSTTYLNSAGYVNHLQPANEPPTRGDLSPSRHWSLVSLFNGHQQNQANQHHHNHLIGQSSTSTYSGGTSLSSSVCSISCSSGDNSRRSSVSAAEAALKTRRIRHPPMVIVANKHDLPEDQHIVNSDEIEALAVIDWNNGFVRASAATNFNIDQIFQQVLKQAKQPPTLTEAILSKRRKSLPPKLPNSMANYPPL